VLIVGWEHLRSQHDLEGDVIASFSLSLIKISSRR
jgi:hypothetical protein